LVGVDKGVALRAAARAAKAARPALTKMVSFCGVWMRLHSTSR
jgi:hypothetical protein